MKNPPHPGEMLGDMLDEMNISVADAAKALGISRQQLHNVIAGRSAITANMAVRLEKGLGGSAGHWLRMQISHDLAQARLKAPTKEIKKLVAAA